MPHNGSSVAGYVEVTAPTVPVTLNACGLDLPPRQVPVPGAERVLSNVSFNPRASPARRGCYPAKQVEADAQENLTPFPRAGSPNPGLRTGIARGLSGTSRTQGGRGVAGG